MERAEQAAGGRMTNDRREAVSEPSFRLAGLSVWVFGYAFSDSQVYWDGNWLNVLARVETPGSWVEVTGLLLRTDDIVNFVRELEPMYRDLRGTAGLQSLEPGISAKVTCNATGHVHIVIDITPDHITESHEYKFDLDQTYLSAVLSDCKRLLDRMPTKDPDQFLLHSRR
jgi:hypothetical protein